MEYTPLSNTLKYTATVISIKENSGNFMGKNGVLNYCHQLELSVDGYPHTHNAQWCNANTTLTEFKKGDDIIIIAGYYNPGKGNQSVKFEKVVRTAAQKIDAALLGKTLSGINTNDNSVGNKHENVPFKDPGQVNPNPMVHGTIWATCLFNAVTFHKDRKTSKLEDVVAAADFFYEHFQTFTL